MFKKWKSVSVTTALSAALLLGITAVPYAANLSNGKASTDTHVVVEVSAQTTTPSTTGSTAKPAEAPEKQKSVFDADMLQSPLSFLKDAGSPDEEDSDIAAKSSMIVLALKALAATLLSTIM